MPRQDQVDISTLSDFCTPWCVHVVATLRIADHIAAGITEIDGLAAALQLQEAQLQKRIKCGKPSASGRL